MQKLNFMVEAEINNTWVHAHVATLEQAQALIAALDASTAQVVDANIFLNESATIEAQAAFDAYKQQFATI